MADTTSVKPAHLTKDTFETTLAAAGDKPVLVDFYADWCGPCQMIAPAIEELVGEFDGKAVITKLNVDDERELAQKFGVMSIPTLMIFKKGQEVEKQVGFLPKTKIVELLNKQLTA